MVVNNPALLPAWKYPDGRGIGVRISVEWVSGWSWNPQHRRLAIEGHSFQRLNEQIKKPLAKRLLADSRLDLNSIAQRLGYAEAASFSRAFSRWTGYPPSYWQRQSEER